MKTRAAVLRALNAPFCVETVELDPPRRGEVLVRMVASGVCQSDLHFITGHRKTFLPAVRGHEGGGVVEAVGEGVTRLAPGERRRVRTERDRLDERHRNHVADGRGP